MPSVEIGPRKVEYSVVKGGSRRYTYFRLKPDLTLEVVLPRGRSVDVEAAIRERLSWISRELDRAAKSKNVLGPDYLMFDGVRLKLVFNQATEGLGLDPRSGIAYINASDSRTVRELVRRLFLKETSTYVVRTVAKKAPLLKVRPRKVDVREISKWGYCTRGGRLSFSWQLIALPEKLREYVVLHELVHLAEFNHSHAFKRILGGVCPDFREREKELDLIIPYERLGPPQ